MLGLVGKQRKRVQRTHKRETYEGTLVDGDLVVKRGCYRRTVDKLGDAVADEYDSQRRLYANIGDRLVVTHHDVAVDELGVFEVVGVVQDGWTETLRVRLLSGTTPRTRDVWVIGAGKAR